MINQRERQLRKYKNDFTIRFANIMSTQLPMWKDVQKKERLSLISPKAFAGYFGTALLGFIPGKHEHDYDLRFHCYLAIGFFIFAIITNIGITNKRYQNKIKSTLYAELVKVFGADVHYICGSAGALLETLLSSNKKPDMMSRIIDGTLENLAAAEASEYSSKTNFLIPNNIFENCSLFNREITQRNDDDRFYGKYNDVEFIINETDFGWNSNDKYNTYNRMFKGVAMHFKMNKCIKNRVLIKSKGLIDAPPAGFSRVVVEYNKFVNKYNIYVNGGDMSQAQVEARYLLNAAFIDRFMQLHTSFRVPKLQCSVYGEDMLIFLSTSKDLFEMNHLFGRIDDIKQYDRLFDEFASVLSFIDVLNLSSKTKL